MPCHDITDSLKILLDDRERLVKYALRKKTCGGDVGRRSLLIKWLKSKTAEEIVSLPPEELFKTFPTKSKTWEYLYIKHFLAVKSGLAIYLGEHSGGVSDYCTIDSIEYGPDGTLLQAELSVDGMTDEIRACGGCSTCSNKI